MGTVHKRIFYYHADASTLGGHFRTPIRQVVPIQTPLSLSPSGGFGSAHSERFSFQDLVSFDRAYTTVSGGINEETGAFTTMVSATVEGLNILGVVTAERLVARISSDSPMEPDRYEPTVTLAGSHFNGLKISGSPVQVDIDQGILHTTGDEDDASHGEAAPNDERTSAKEPLPLIQNSAFIRKVQQQYDRMRDPDSLPNWVTDRTVPGWVSERYPADLRGKIDQRGMILCSLVKSTVGEFAGTPYGSVFSVPEFGRIFLGEVLIDRNTHRLIMARVELGCGFTADLSASAVAVEGRGHP